MEMYCGAKKSLKTLVTKVVLPYPPCHTYKNDHKFYR